ncbi:MAG: COG4315 family predicted lipoprotein [Thermoleophilaceae bacterium]
MRASLGIPLAVVILVVALVGCGGDDRVESPQAEGATVTATESTVESGAQTSAELSVRPPGSEGLRVPAKRVQITVRESPLGDVLFDANGQVVYVFEIDGPNRSNCTSQECVKAWPPVLTQEQPTAGTGVDEALLGTMRRSDGQLQVTYKGRPLYFYEHEGPGEIRCHNVDLHGGLWWVVTPSGTPAD